MDSLSETNESVSANEIYWSALSQYRSKSGGSPLRLLSVRYHANAWSSFIFLSPKWRPPRVTGRLDMVSSSLRMLSCRQLYRCANDEYPSFLKVWHWSKLNSWNPRKTLNNKRWLPCRLRASASSSHVWSKGCAGIANSGLGGACSVSDPVLIFFLYCCRVVIFHGSECYGSRDWHQVCHDLR